MRHYYKIKNYIKEEDVFELEDSEGTHYVAIDEIEHSNPEELIGKNISVSYLKPYIEIGVGARIED